MCIKVAQELHVSFCHNSVYDSMQKEGPPLELRFVDTLEGQFLYSYLCSL